MTYPPGLGFDRDRPADYDSETIFEQELAMTGRGDPDDDARLEALILRVGSGDRAALRELYTTTSPRLMGLCSFLLTEREAASAALKDVYVAIWRRARHYRAGTDAPLRWLLTATREAVVDGHPTGPGDPAPHGLDSLPGDSDLKRRLAALPVETARA